MCFEDDCEPQKMMNLLAAEDSGSVTNLSSILNIHLVIVFQLISFILFVTVCFHDTD